VHPQTMTYDGPQKASQQIKETHSTKVLNSLSTPTTHQASLTGALILKFLMTNVPLLVVGK